MSTTIRIADEAAHYLQKIADEQRVSIGTVVNDLVRLHRKQQMFEELNRYYAELRADPEGWAEEVNLRQAMEGTLKDGLDRVPYDDPRLAEPATRVGD